MNKKFLKHYRSIDCTVVAALVYQNYCIEKQSIEEISKEFNVNEKSVQLMVQYYDKKAAS